MEMRVQPFAANIAKFRVDAHNIIALRAGSELLDGRGELHACFISPFRSFAFVPVIIT